MDMIFCIGAHHMHPYINQHSAQGCVSHYVLILIIFLMVLACI